MALAGPRASTGRRWRRASPGGQPGPRRASCEGRAGGAQIAAPPRAHPRQDAAAEADPLFADAFVVADGPRFYTVVPVAAGGGRLPILLFPDAMPPANRDLAIIRVNQPRPMAAADDASVICFTPGTRLRTETGEVTIEDLGPGDRILTRDDGPQALSGPGSGGCRARGCSRCRGNGRSGCAPARSGSTGPTPTLSCRPITGSS